MKIKITLLIGLVVSLSGCLSNFENVSTDPVASVALDKQTLMQLFTGSTMYLAENDIVQVSFFSDDNTMKGNVWGSWLSQIDQGNWMINERGQFCNQWQGIWSQGDDYNCYRIIPGESNDQYFMVLETEETIDPVELDSRLVTITSAGANEFE